MSSNGLCSSSSSLNASLFKYKISHPHNGRCLEARHQIRRAKQASIQVNPGLPLMPVLSGELAFFWRAIAAVAPID